MCDVQVGQVRTALREQTRIIRAEAEQDELLTAANFSVSGGRYYLSMAVTQSHESG